MNLKEAHRYLQTHFFDSWNTVTFGEKVGLSLFINKQDNSEDILKNLTDLFTWIFSTSKDIRGGIYIKTPNIFELENYKEILSVINSGLKKVTDIFITIPFDYINIPENLSRITLFLKEKNETKFEFNNLNFKFKVNVEDSAIEDFFNFNQLFLLKNLGIKVVINISPLNILFLKKNINNILNKFKIDANLKSNDILSFIKFKENREVIWSPEALKAFASLIYKFIYTFKSLYTDNSLFLKDIFLQDKLGLFPEFLNKREEYRKTLSIRMKDNIIIINDEIPDKLQFAKIIFTENNFNLNIINSELFLLINSFSRENITKCDSCFFSALCNYCDLSNNYKLNGDLFCPVDNICDLEKIKIINTCQALKDLNLLSLLISTYYLQKDISKQNAANFLTQIISRGLLK